MASSEYDRWRRYWNQEPWGPWRDNMHASIIASKLHNIFRRKNSLATAPEDFMLRTREEGKSRETGKSLQWLKAVAKRKAQ